MSVEAATATVLPPVNDCEDGGQPEDDADEDGREGHRHDGVAQRSG